MKAEVLGDVFAHIDTCGFGAKDADLEVLRVHQAHGRGRQRNYDRPVFFGLRVGDGKLAPGLVDGGVEETELKVALDCDVLCKPVGIAGGRFDENILTIEAETFVCDFGSLDLQRT
jgi:hypothetical protein